jgi:hypothetical protein
MHQAAKICQNSNAYRLKKRLTEKQLEVIPDIFESFVSGKCFLKSVENLDSGLPKQHIQLVNISHLQI